MQGNRTERDMLNGWQMYPPAGPRKRSAACLRVADCLCNTCAIDQVRRPHGERCCLNRCAANGKLPCPVLGCRMYMKEE